MCEYAVSEIKPNDKRGNRLMVQLLQQEGIDKDGNLDYSIGLYDDNFNMVATGSCYKNTLRCMAVDSGHQGEGLMNKVVSHLMEYQRSRGNMDLFLYTKYNSAKFFADLGFHEITRVDGKVVFMESRRTGFSDYLVELASTAVEAPRVASIVMNANPFTLGHQYLVEKAAAENDYVHLFVVSEDASLVPFDVRYELVKQGTAHLKNIIYHKTGSYVISNATFPSYFLKDSTTVITSHAKLDISIFARIAAALKVNYRYVGEEPFSQVTGIYNQIMAEELPKSGVSCVVVPRREQDGAVISASTVRKAIAEDKLDAIRDLVPASTYAYFTSAAAEPVIRRIKEADNVVHY